MKLHHTEPPRKVRIELERNSWRSLRGCGPHKLCTLSAERIPCRSISLNSSMCKSSCCATRSSFRPQICSKRKWNQARPERADAEDVTENELRGNRNLRGTIQRLPRSQRVHIVNRVRAYPSQYRFRYPCKRIHNPCRQLLRTLIPEGIASGSGRNSTRSSAQTLSHGSQASCIRCAPR